MLTIVVFQTSSRLAGASIGNRVTVAKSHCLFSLPAYTHSLPSAGFCHSAIAKPSASFRKPVPSQLTTKISGGPGTIRLEKTMRSPRGVSRGMVRLRRSPRMTRSPLPSSESKPIRIELSRRRRPDPCRPPAPRRRECARPSARGGLRCLRRRWPAFRGSNRQPTEPGRRERSERGATALIPSSDRVFSYRREVLSWYHCPSSTTRMMAGGT